MASRVSLHAIARTCEWRAMKSSRFFASPRLRTVQMASRPLMSTGLGGPMSKTSRLSGVIQAPRSNQHDDRSFQQRLDRGQQFRAECAVDDAVIASQRCRQHAREDNAAVRTFYRLAPRGAD